jgi:hypothetical protein
VYDLPLERLAGQVYVACEKNNWGEADIGNPDQLLQGEFYKTQGELCADFEASFPVPCNHCLRPAINFLHGKFVCGDPACREKYGRIEGYGT